ncbi:MAG: polysaccharide deacetylase family protein [Sphingomonadales bacterium]|nr:polysaccharide deacetylase family protein [Sphingomonadales bacterium]
MREPNILAVPADRDRVAFAPGFGQRFIVTVDTEEEFDWGKPLHRTEHELGHVPRIAKFQEFCEGHGVVPLYLIDYPVATDPVAAEILREPVAAGRAEVGVQLHPWVSPPFEEEVCEFNSFSGNLPEALERAKFHKLRDAIEEAFGATPLVYRAGRYGVGPRSAGILRECGIAIDTSVRAQFNYSGGGGPDFTHHPLAPYWIDRDAGLMEMPLTTVFWGPLRRQGRALYPRLWRAPRLRGLLSRLGLLERIALTPEGISADEAIKAIDIAIDDALPLLVFSFHSPSLDIGHTPYVKTADDLEQFYDWWRRAFAYLEQRSVHPASVREIIAAAQA